MRLDESPHAARADTMHASILIVDDEASIREVLARYLLDEGFLVDEAGDGAAALERIAAGGIDLLLLDLNLPKVSGLDVFREVRKRSQLPTIMLTSRKAEVDRVLGLELGADDYVGKPFSPREVVARVKAVLRRTAAARETESPTAVETHLQQIGALCIDRRAILVTLNGRPVGLTPTEYRIVDLLAQNLGCVLSREQLLQGSTTNGYEVFDRTLDRHIANVRQKIEPDPKRPRYLITMFGFGYKMVEPT